MQTSTSDRFIIQKATDGTRTCDLSFTKALLYQLSYGGAKLRIVAKSNLKRQVASQSSGHAFSHLANTALELIMQPQRHLSSIGRAAVL